MDEVARYNQARWKALAEVDALFTRPRFDLDIKAARDIVDPEGKLGDLQGRDVLCLAGGGGRQSAAFSILGAKATVYDLSPEQLERDRAVAKHYGFEIETICGDMRDLSALPAQSFDLVDHAYSLNFVPDCVAVFEQVARVLRSGGLYRVSCTNPFIMGTQQSDWNGTGYSLKEPYVDGAMVTYTDQEWVYDPNLHDRVPKPREYRHTLSTFLNGLIGTGFTILHVADRIDMDPDPKGEPGTWDHFVAYAPPWLSFVARLGN